jgi:hypothetical protein
MELLCKRIMAKELLSTTIMTNEVVMHKKNEKEAS